MGKKKNGYDYISEMKDWQDHQYNPAHFTGGKIPYHDLLPGKPFVMGIIYIVFGVIFIGLIIYSEIGQQLHFLNDILPLVIILIILCFFIVVGIRYLKMAKQRRENRGIIKKSHKKR